MHTVASILDHELAAEVVAALHHAGVPATASAGDATGGLVPGALATTVTISILNDEDMPKARAVLTELGIATGTMDSCGRCGYDLRGHIDGALCPECGAAIVVSMADAFCPGCGERVPGNFGVCWSCGASMDEAPRVVARETVAAAQAAGAGAFDGGRRQRFSTIAHADHVFMSPLAEEKVERVLDCVGLDAGQRAVDIGCGTGEMLIRLVERAAAAAPGGAGGGFGLGIDRSEPAVEAARRRAAARPSAAARTHIEWRVGDAAALAGDAHVFDAALCVGSTGALGGYRPALRVLRHIVRPQGIVVVGEGFWRRAPHPEYLEALGASPNEMTAHAGNVAAAVASGFTPIYSVVSSDDEWDHYEGLYLRSMEGWLAANPGDPDHAAFASRMRAWRDAYLRWGRSTLGFGVYVLRCADSA